MPVKQTTMFGGAAVDVTPKAVVEAARRVTSDLSMDVMMAENRTRTDAERAVKDAQAAVLASKPDGWSVEPEPERQTFEDMFGHVYQCRAIRNVDRAEMTRRGHQYGQFDKWMVVTWRKTSGDEYVYTTGRTEDDAWSQILSNNEFWKAQHVKWREWTEASLAVPEGLTDAQLVEHFKGRVDRYQLMQSERTAHSYSLDWEPPYWGGHYNGLGSSCLVAGGPGAGPPLPGWHAHDDPMYADCPPPFVPRDAEAFIRATLAEQGYEIGPIEFCPEGGDFSAPLLRAPERKPHRSSVESTPLFGDGEQDDDEMWDGQ